MRIVVDPDNVDAILDFIEAEAVSVMPATLEDRLPDPDDEPFLEVAIAGRVDALVTGNLVHYPAPVRRGVAVLGPTEFLARIREV